MPFDRDEWFALTKERAEAWVNDMPEELFACGEMLRGTAWNLQEEWEAEMRRDTRGRERLRLRGYGIAVPVLQALAAEYLLKGLSLRESGRYLKTHDLHNLYEALGPETKPRLASVEVSDIGTKLPEFLEAHRNDFADWRYVFEGRGASTQHVVFDRTLEALIAASNS